MTAVFADTFYWVALTDPNDALYGEALRLETLYSESSIFTTDEVLSEFLTFFSCSSLLRRRAVETIQALAQDPRVRIVAQSRASFRAGLDLYASRPDKCYSLTGCISMQAMRSAGLTAILTNDRHFEQEGFQILFRR